MEQVASEEQIRALFEDLDPSEIIDVPARKGVLESLLSITKERAPSILTALHDDLGRHYHESCLIELFPVVGDIKHTLAKMSKWAKPDSVKAPAVVFPSKIRIDKVPLGKGLIITPFNFPFFLSLPYVAMAIAAGNAVVVRPSGKTPNCARVLSEIAQALDRPHIFKVVVCTHETADAMTALSWDKIFYTGSTSVGRHIMELAAPNLVPLTLELGGKSPVIVTRYCDVELAAKRIAFGKTVNCGQICVSPDYVLIESNGDCPGLTTKFISEYTKCIKAFYGDDPRLSASYSRMISPDAADRIKTMIEEAEIASARTEDEVENEAAISNSAGTAHSNTPTVILGKSTDVDAEAKYVPPTIILNPDVNMQCMQEEIFGPVLVVIEVGSLAGMLDFISQRPRPLVLYAFTDDKDEIDTIRRETRSGDLVFNDTVLHAMISDGCFGGVGQSGMGVAHGYHAFLSWCTLRTTMERNAHGGLSQVDKFFRYAPYEETYQKALGILSAGWAFDWKEEMPEGAAGVGHDGSRGDIQESLTE